MEKLFMKNSKIFGFERSLTHFALVHEKLEITWGQVPRVIFDTISKLGRMVHFCSVMR